MDSNVGILSRGAESSQGGYGCPCPALGWWEEKPSVGNARGCGKMCALLAAWCCCNPWCSSLCLMNSFVRLISCCSLFIMAITQTVF